VRHFYPTKGQPITLMVNRFFINASRPNFYSTTAGSLIQFGHFVELKRSNVFIINKTWPGSTTAGSLMQFPPLGS
jgi:hypothetical protein